MRLEDLPEVGEIFRSMNNNPPKRKKLHCLKVGKLTLRQIFQKNDLQIGEAYIERVVLGSDFSYLGVDNYFYVSQKGAERYSIPLKDLRQPLDARRNTLFFPQTDESYVTVRKRRTPSYRFRKKMSSKK